MDENERLTTGVPGLDPLLGGGLRARGLHVALGRPGAGKTVLAHQIGAHHIRQGGKVLYLTALVETHQMLIAQARTFRFFDSSVVPGSFYYASLYPAIARGGAQGAREEISRLVAHHGASLVVIDGMHALKQSAESPLDYQRFVHELEAQATVSGVTTLLLVHPDPGMTSDPTFTIADGIFRLATLRTRLRHIRVFGVEKLRGVGHTGGWHTFTITSGGLHIVPRLESMGHRLESSPAGNPPREPDPPLLDFAVRGLGEMLGGGLDQDSTTLLVGTPGSGKTLTGLAFLAAGAEVGAPGLLVGFHEMPEKLLRKGEGVGLPLRRAVRDGLLHIHWRSPSELLADEIAEQLLSAVEKHGIRRVVIDAVEDLRHIVIPQTREIHFLATLGNLLRERGVATLMMMDISRVVGLNFDLPMADLSATMDNVLHSRYVEQGGELRRMISILKIRAHGYDRRLREYHISPEGMWVGEPFEGRERLLTGLPSPRPDQGS